MTPQPPSLATRSVVKAASAAAKVAVPGPLVFRLTSALKSMSKKILASATGAKLPLPTRGDNPAVERLLQTFADRVSNTACRKASPAGAELANAR
eukprot:CAMPEP_0115321398 /NCGR_PEP_ID=MMETSP0270-20121206/80839_1 /TAXON_ID=71861 /ORGANISM="Scrippsiella trochoidea, Strain CCMP3099" /LENGTH=94 /DNA_ID=CAMNT_0002741277 /DNA_START=727 /DNA_END=1007 /DNA_ORIENTATION=-